MDVTRCQACRNRSANDFWRVNSTNKLFKDKFAAIGAVDGHSRHITWLIFFNNNRGNTTYYLFKESNNEHIIPLQVIGDKGLENRLTAKHMVMVHNTQ